MGKEKQNHVDMFVQRLCQETRFVKDMNKIIDDYKEMIDHLSEVDFDSYQFHSDKNSQTLIKLKENIIDSLINMSTMMCDTIKFKLEEFEYEQKKE